jgi:hypothetical protein
MIFAVIMILLEGVIQMFITLFHFIAGMENFIIFIIEFSLIIFEFHTTIFHHFYSIIQFELKNLNIHRIHI